MFWNKPRPKNESEILKIKAFVTKKIRAISEVKVYSTRFPKRLSIMQTLREFGSRPLWVKDGLWAELGNNTTQSVLTNG